MGVKKIYAIAPNPEGWRKLPLGNYVKLGNDVKLGSGVALGNDVTLGNGVTLGDYCSPLQLQGPVYSVYPHSRGRIGVGCTVLSWSEWQEKKDEIANKKGVAVADYEPLVTFLREWMQRHDQFSE